MIWAHRAQLAAWLRDELLPHAYAEEATVFTTHLAKENDLVVQLLVDAEDVSLANLLDGMHDLVGCAARPDVRGRRLRLWWLRVRRRYRRRRPRGADHRLPVASRRGPFALWAASCPDHVPVLLRRG